MKVATSGAHLRATGHPRTLEPPESVTVASGDRSTSTRLLTRPFGTRTGYAPHQVVEWGEAEGCVTGGRFLARSIVAVPWISVGSTWCQRPGPGIVDNPCPDRRLGDRCEVFIARYRFVCLEMGSDRMRLPPDHIEVMIDRLGALNVEFEKFLVEVQ